jgi:hypothetical protein
VLYYHRARYYDPQARRFISEDPIGLDGGINLYAYVGNNPLNLTDPDGKCGPLCAVLIGFGIYHLMNPAHVNAPGPGDPVYKNDTYDRVLGGAVIGGLASYGGELAGPIVGKVLQRLLPGTKPAIQFAQKAISPVFGNGEFAGKTVQEVAAGLRSGAIESSQLPLQTITRNGITYTFNNRSLVALRMAQMEPSMIMDFTGDAFYEKLLTERLSELGNAVGPKFVPPIRPPHQ